MLSQDEREELAAYRALYSEDIGESREMQMIEALRLPFKGANRTARLILVKLYMHKRTVRLTELASWMPQDLKTTANRFVLVYICHLRRVFRDKHGLPNDESITNAWGQGYMLTPRAREIVSGLLHFDLR
jgi:DNA-binding response OmpR family regulator